MSQERHTVELADGRRVKFTIAPRSGEPHYFVYFRGLDGRRLERSTNEASRKRAVEAAVQIVKEEYNPRPAGEGVTWDDAAAAMVRAMKACYEKGMGSSRAIPPPRRRVATRSARRPRTPRGGV